MNKDIVAQIVGDEYVDSWLSLNPKVYYKDNQPYGLVSMIEVNGVVYVASTAKNIEDMFTIGMLRDFVKVAKLKEVCVITDVPSKFEHIQKFFDKIGSFRYTFKDGILYSQGRIQKRS